MKDIIYVITDIDMNETISLCKTMDRVLREAFETLTACGYERFIFEQNKEIEDVWYITFPHDDAMCVGHWRIERMEVED